MPLVTIVDLACKKERWSEGNQDSELLDIRGLYPDKVFCRWHHGGKQRNGCRQMVLQGLERLSV